ELLARNKEVVLPGLLLGARLARRRRNRIPQAPPAPSEGRDERVLAGPGRSRDHKQETRPRDQRWTPFTPAELLTSNLSQQSTFCMAARTLGSGWALPGSV